MATPDVLQRENDLLPSYPLFDHPKAENAKSRGLAIEKKIEFLEGLAGKVSNRRSRRWLNDRLLMELVPRLNAEEIRGLFAPPPWGEDVPLSPFCKTNVGEWDKFRHIDMDKEVFHFPYSPKHVYLPQNSYTIQSEQCNKFLRIILPDFNMIEEYICAACNRISLQFWNLIPEISETTIIEALESSSSKRKGRVDADKTAVLNAWHRVDCRTREALRRSFLSDLVNGYEECIRAFIKESGDIEVLVLHVQDPFHRLLLHGVCEFYNLVSVTVPQSKGMELAKMTRIKKKAGSVELPNITLCQFLKMAKEGIW